MRKLRICVVSDFFCPNTGGVETHIYYLSQCLIQRGHTVVVITHRYGDRTGIRYLSNSLKVYYLPFLVFYNGCVLPTVYTTLPWIRFILLRERIDVVHGHSSFSALAHESMFHAQAMGIKTVFTDHSLFGFADATSILTNKLLQFSLANADHVICVSHTSKENTTLRARLRPDKVSVIPNAVNCESFQPDPQKFANNPLTIVVISRLVYRKGTDLLATLIPEMCSMYPDIRFVVGGDGPKRIILEEVRERHQLHERVSLLGTVPHSQVRQILVEGQIFLNTSLTEAFCMAIVEAASCGLHVVTTKVGGIPEVLPPDLMTMSDETSAKGLIKALNFAIKNYREGKRKCSLPDPLRIHKRVSNMYYWPDIAERVEHVYHATVFDRNIPSVSTKLKRFFKCGTAFGCFFIFIAIIDLFLLKILDLFHPKSSISPANDELLLHNSAHDPKLNNSCLKEKKLTRRR